MSCRSSTSTHPTTKAVLQQNRASDQWNFYQARKIRQYNTELTSDLLSTLNVRDQAAASKVLNSYKAHLDKWNDELTESQKKAAEFESDVRRAEEREDRFDLGEALLEIGLVI